MKNCNSFTLATWMLIISIIVSCTKKDGDFKKSENHATNQMLFKSNQEESSASNSGDEYETHFTDIFKSINKVELEMVFETENNEALTQIINETNERIVSLVQDQYNINLNEQFDEDEHYNITLIGIYFAAKEKYLLDGHELGIDIDEYGIVNHSYEETFQCFLTAVGAFIGVTQANEIWKSIIAGATKETIIGTIKLLGKKVATLWGVGVLIYQVGNCLDWW